MTQYNDPPSTVPSKHFVISNSCHSNSPQGDDLAHRRLPTCLSLLILLTIVYVLSRTSSSSTCTYDLTSLNMGAIRKQMFANQPPHIIECSSAGENEDQSACHLPRPERYAALKQKGATLWMTGCSGAGKTTIATALEEKVRCEPTPPFYPFQLNL